MRDFDSKSYSYSSFIVSISAAALMAPSLAAQATAGPKRPSDELHPAVQEALAARHEGYKSFVNDAGGRWKANFNETTGAPSLIFGSGLEISNRSIDSMAPAQAAAQAVLAKYPKLWGAPLSQFELQTKWKQGQLYILTWGQKWDGLEVRGGRIQIQVHEAGRVAALVAEGVPIPDGFSRLPKLGPEQAEAIVKKGKRIAPGDAVDATDFLIFNKAEHGRGEARLAYRVDVTQPWANVYERVFVDANDGTILEIEPGRYNFDVQGKVTGTINTSLVGSTAPVANIPIPNVTVTVTGVGTATTDANGDYTIATALPGPFNVSAQLSGPKFNVNTSQGSKLSAAGATVNVGGIQTGNLAFNGAGDQFGTAQTNAAYHHTIIFDYVKSKMPSFAGFGQQGITVNINDTCNAYFDPNVNTLNFFASGGGCINSSYSTVLYHEFGHGVDDFYGNIVNGGLSEAIGDIVAMFATAQPIVGAGFQGAGSYIRTGENATKWPASACGGESHCVGETFMGFGWQAYKLLTQNYGPATGAAAAEKAFFGILPANNSSIPNAVTQVFISDDNDGNLANGTPHYLELSTAAIMKGFTPPVVTIDPITIVHSRHPDTFNQSQPYAIYAQITAEPGHTITQAFLDYSYNGSSPQSVVMQPSGQPSMFIGEIPPVAGPMLISYWIRAVSSNAANVKIPLGDDAFRFAVGKKTILFSSNLESGSSGWTHVQVKTQDDWNWGPLQTLATNIYDPKNAFSGVNCWGNDLQNQATNQDGLYKPSVENYIETPNINASGKTGVRVRFRRWLTVESGQYDQAEVYVNNAKVYSNPQLTDTLDSEWTLQDYAAPSADNISSFRVRWRLKSDAGLEYGGWNFDDVEVYALEPTPVLSMNLFTAPDVNLGTNMSMVMTGTPSAGWQIFISLDPGPGALDGFGVFGAGLGSFTYVTEGTFDNGGTAFFILPIPTLPVLSGLSFYWVGGAIAPPALPQISNTVKTTFH